MDNQQERFLESKQLKQYGDLNWLVGLWEGEGTFTLVAGSKRRIMPRLSLINSDFDLIDEVSRILTDNMVGHYIQTRKGGCTNNPKHKDVKTVSICGLKRVAHCVRTFMPYIRGNKRKVAQLVGEYAEHRLGLPKNASYTDKDYTYVKAVRVLNRKGPEKSSETTRQAPVYFRGKKI
jgi:hypothetical protein